MIAYSSQTVRRVALTLGSAAVFVPAALLAQNAPSTPYMNRNLIVLDPAHGGQDAGASLNGQPEKSITLALAASLKALLSARGFTVVMTREGDLADSSPVLTTDQRAGVANHLRPVACIVLHATGTGGGVHLTSSSLPEPSFDYEPAPQLPWETAQTVYLPQSQRLANDLGLALLRAKVPVLLTRAALRPLDNLTCPAIAVEVAPLAVSGSRPTPVTDSGYQQRIAETLAAALFSWREATVPRPAPKVVPAPITALGATP